MNNKDKKIKDHAYELAMDMMSETLGLDNEIVDEEVDSIE